MKLYYTEAEAYKLSNVKELNQRMFYTLEHLPIEDAVGPFSSRPAITCRYFRKELIINRSRIAFYINEVYKDQVIKMLLDAYNKERED